MHSLTKYLALLAVTVFACSAARAQPTLYWADQSNNKIQRLDLARPVIEDVVEGLLAGPGNMALDVEKGHMYWSSTGRRTIVRANTDGSDLHSVQDGQLVALDVKARQMYVLLDTTLIRTTMDGDDKQVLMELTGLTGSGHLFPPVAIDLREERVYWSFARSSDDGVYRSGVRSTNLDGTDQELFFDNTGHGIAFLGLALDTVGGKLYMIDAWGPHNLSSVDLDGTGLQWMDHHRQVSGIVVDPMHQKLYWVASSDPPFIRRSNLDGSDVEDLIPLEGDVSALALDVTNERLYWNSPFGVWRSELDGTGIERLVATNVANLRGIALDRSAGQIYWTNGQSIGRYDLDGFHEEMIVEGLVGRVEDVAIDHQRGFLYWSLTTDTGSGPSIIQRSRLDGSEAQDLVVSTETRLGALALDVKNDRLYWATGDGVYGANTDGSDVITVLLTPRSWSPEIIDLAIDAESQRIYWLRRPRYNPNDYIGWTSADGSATATASLYWGDVSAIAFDPVGRHIYWAESKWGHLLGTRAGAIWRRSVDNDTEIELVAGGVGFVSSLAIDAEETVTGVAADPIPSTFLLGQNYPNPFNPATSIQYILSSTERISIKVRDALGRIVAVPVDEVRPAGTHQVTWTAESGTPSGVYFYTLETGAGAVTRSMLLLK